MNQLLNENSEKRNVLYIEDNQMNVELVQAMFEILPDIELSLAADAETGIHKALSSRPDLILMDVGLPGMDGLTAAKILKENDETKDVPIIALSAAAMEHEVGRADDSIILEYVTKPFNISNFIKLIENTLSLKQK